MGRVFHGLQGFHPPGFSEAPPRRVKCGSHPPAAAWRTGGAMRRALGLKSPADKPMIRSVRNLRVIE
jgi:hypothetical protein